MKKLLLLIFISTIVMGCGARLASTSDKDVVVSNVTRSTAGDALRIAEKECAKYRKQAFRLSEENGAVTYRCVE